MLREAVVDDAGRMAQLMMEHPLWQQYKASLEEQTQRVACLIAVRQSFLLEKDGVLLGFVLFDTNTFGGNGYIQLLAVRLDSTGKGVGRALLVKAHEQIARVSSRAFLMCTATNTSAQRFYERNGYVKVGELPGWLQPDIDEYIFCNYDVRRSD